MLDSRVRKTPDRQHRRVRRGCSRARTLFNVKSHLQLVRKAIDVQTPAGRSDVEFEPETVIPRRKRVLAEDFFNRC